MARLRRAFLLRVHPDRFREAPIRAQQARLVQALSNRMSQPDFSAWQQRDDRTFNSTSNKDVYPFVLEKRDGSLLQSSLAMNASVDSILSTIVHALEEVGASLPEPPPVRRHVSSTHRKQTSNDHPPKRHTSNGRPRGRSLQQFLADRQQPEEIQKRRISRVDAQAAASAVRRLYHFQAVDATTLGWSSAWVATLLRRLLELHPSNPHFKVDSFYPIRLLFTNAAAKISIEEGNHHALDLYGGVMRLSPAGTSVQWLETLGSVTYQRIEQIHYHQQRLLEFTKKIQTVLGVKINKGYSCGHAEYYAFLERLSNSLDSHITSTLVLQSFHLSTKPIVMTVESSQMCRRPLVTHDGKLRLGSFMDTSTILRSIAELGPVAMKRRHEHAEQMLQQKEWIQQAQSQLGLQQVYTTAAHADFVKSIQRLLVETDESMQQRLGGNALGIAASDRFCHLADDGSLVIPHNWV